jgi:hypothetical protein
MYSPFVQCHRPPIWPHVFPLYLTYFVRSLKFTREPVLYRLFTFRVIYLIPIYLSFGRLTKESVQFLGSFRHCVISLFVTPDFQPHAQPPSWWSTLSRLSATAWWTSVTYLERYSLLNVVVTVHFDAEAKSRHIPEEEQVFPVEVWNVRPRVPY